MVEPETRRSPEELIVDVAEPPTASELADRMPLKRLVDVAEVEVELPLTKRLPVTRKFASTVLEAAERKPFSKPSVVEVETPQLVTANGNELPPVGHELSQVSAVKQIVSKVALLAKRFVVVAEVPVARLNCKNSVFTDGPEKVELLKVALVNVPPSLSLLS